ncbi:MAG TPA: sigma-70 family RNA polymerase sigma factor [Negativicutes bacterium]|nr:sigma-70 family RNA polymerase sigma factor [Negativicutes bacterium]
MLQLYLQELNKLKLLEQDEEAALWAGYKENGNLQSRKQLIEQYQPLVFKQAIRITTNHNLVMDIIQEGTVGLIEAVENYNHTRGVAFSLYAQHRIRGRMLDYLQREGKAGGLSIDQSVGESPEEKPSLLAYLNDTAMDIVKMTERNYCIEQMQEAFKRLPAKEQMVLDGVFRLEQRPQQLADDLNLSLTHIYRLQKQGIRRLRGMLSKLISEFKND